MNNINRQEQVAPTADMGLVLALLVERGARLFDPVRFRYIEAMARRTEQNSGATKQVLERKLAQALADYQARFEKARQETATAVEYVAAQHPGLLDDAQRRFASGDFKGVRQLVDRLTIVAPSGPLAELTSYMLRGERGNDNSQVDDVSGARTFEDMLRKQEIDARQISADGLASSAQASPRHSSELRPMQFFRNTWAKLSAEKRVAQAIENPSENAGPLNSHRLVVRSISTMRDISPEYLNRFVSYIDTLLWLEQAGMKSDSAVTKVQPVKAKPKPRRKPAT